MDISSSTCKKECLGLVGFQISKSFVSCYEASFLHDSMGLLQPFDWRSTWFLGQDPRSKSGNWAQLGEPGEVGCGSFAESKGSLPIQLCEAPAKSLLGHTECKDSSYLTSFATCVSWFDLEIKGQFLLLLIPNGILEGFRNSTLGRFAIAERQRIHG